MIGRNDIVVSLTSFIYRIIFPKVMKQLCNITIILLKIACCFIPLLFVVATITVGMVWLGNTDYCSKPCILDFFKTILSSWPGAFLVAVLVFGLPIIYSLQADDLTIKTPLGTFERKRKLPEGAMPVSTIEMDNKAKDEQ